MALKVPRRARCPGACELKTLPSVSAEDGRLDEYVLSLGRAGVAVRRLELLAPPLESMFFALTGAESVPETVSETALEET